jgi:hypothetical protein
VVKGPRIVVLSMLALVLLGRLKRRCAGRLPRVFVDGGDWYP